MKTIKDFIVLAIAWVICSIIITPRLFGYDGFGTIYEYFLLVAGVVWVIVTFGALFAIGPVIGVLTYRYQQSKRK